MNLICLMSNIIPALDHHKIISKVEAKKKAGLIAIYKDLNAHLLNSISYLTNAID